MEGAVRGWSWTAEPEGGEETVGESELGRGPAHCSAQMTKRKEMDFRSS